MAGGRYPFDAASDTAVEKKIAKGRPELSSVTDRVACDFVEKMLEDIPADRPSAERPPAERPPADRPPADRPSSLQHWHCGLCRKFMHWHYGM